MARQRDGGDGGDRMTAAAHPLVEHAVVIGGSIAGLLAARVLADHVGRVTVLDRDDLPADPADRRGVPQSPHQHVLLRSGRRVLDELLPGTADVLRSAGAHELDLAADVAWLAPGGWMVTCPSSLATSSCSRALLEWAVRSQVAELPNVAVQGASVVERLLVGPDRLVRDPRASLGPFAGFGGQDLVSGPGLPRQLQPLVVPQELQTWQEPARCICTPHE